MRLSYTDTHAHLTSESMLTDTKEVLERAQANWVEKIVNICTDEKSLNEGLTLHKRYPWVYNTAATTPHDVDKEGEYFFPFVEQCAMQKSLIAIGETGLDYHHMHSKKETQRAFLSRYFALAIKYQLPLIFHCRDAFPDLFAMADSEYPGHPAVLHCFTGNLEEAKGVFERGWYLSLSGIVTFKKSEYLREVARFAPIERLFLETDSPYLAPQKHRGKRNEPSFLPETAQTIAEVKKMALADVVKTTSENADQFFAFSKQR